MKTDQDLTDVPRSSSSVTLSLECIQKRCTELLAKPDALSELSLVDPLDVGDGTNPYDLG